MNNHPKKFKSAAKAPRGGSLSLSSFHDVAKVLLYDIVDKHSKYPSNHTYCNFLTAKNTAHKNIGTFVGVGVSPGARMSARYSVVARVDRQPQ